jgi:hypothetical protein
MPQTDMYFLMEYHKLCFFSACKKPKSFPTPQTDKSCKSMAEPRRDFPTGKIFSSKNSALPQDKRPYALLPANLVPDGKLLQRDFHKIISICPQMEPE